MKFALCAIGAMFAVISHLHAVEIIAHRGASHDAPENTIAALKLGWEQNADGNEFDVYLSSDRKIVLLHDKTTKRTAGVDLPVVKQTLEDLRKLDAGSWKAASFAGEKIPTMAEALAVIPKGKRVFIEIKCGPEILPELKKEIAASGKSAAQLVIIAFNYDVVTQAKKLMPELQVYWLSSADADKKTGEVPKIEKLIEKAKAAGLDGLNLNYKFPIDAKFVQQVKSAGLKLYTWTVNDAAVAKQLVAAGVDGITTDRPAWLREQLAGAQ
jgi:glycerophosphoryl diester phosphodiesterase